MGFRVEKGTSRPLYATSSCRSRGRGKHRCLHSTNPHRKTESLTAPLRAFYPFQTLPPGEPAAQRRSGGNLPVGRRRIRRNADATQQPIHCHHRQRGRLWCRGRPELSRGRRRHPGRPTALPVRFSEGRRRRTRIRGPAGRRGTVTESQTYTLLRVRHLPHGRAGRRAWVAGFLRVLSLLLPEPDWRIRRRYQRAQTGRQMGRGRGKPLRRRTLLSVEFRARSPAGIPLAGCTISARMGAWHRAVIHTATRNRHLSHREIQLGYSFRMCPIKRVNPLLRGFPRRILQILQSDHIIAPLSPPSLGDR